MNLQITARRFKLSDKLDTLIKKETAALAKHHDHITDVYVVLTTDHGIRNVDMTVHVTGHTMNSVAENDQQFDQILPVVIKKMTTQLQKHKEKLKKL